MNVLLDLNTTPLEEEPGEDVPGGEDLPGGEGVAIGTQLHDFFSVFILRMNL